jgi:hypothetical protein
MDTKQAIRFRTALKPMTPTSNINVTLDRARSQRPQLLDFVNVCGSLRNCLNQVGRCIAEAEVEYEINDLGKGSAVIEVAPALNGVAPAIADEVSAVFKRTIEDLESGRDIDERLDFSAIHAFNGFCSAISKDGNRLRVGETMLTQTFVRHIRDLLAAASPALGSVAGHLDALTIHDQNRFTLYPPAAGEHVQCNFEPADLSRVLGAVGKKVTVFGKLYYAKTKAFPSRVDVEDFIVEPADADLPNLLDARGILRNHKPPDVETRGWRDEWD